MEEVLWSRVFLGGQAVSMLGDGLAVLAVPLLVLQLTRSPMAAVLASLPGSAGYLAAGLPAGVVADRVDPWLVLISGDILRAVIFLALFLLTRSALPAAWQILALAFAAGAVTVFADTALAIAVRDVFTGPRVLSANSWLESANQGGLIIGPSVAGLLAAAHLLHDSMLIDAATFVVSLASLTGAIRHRHRAVAAAPEPATWRALGRDLAAGLRYLAATRLLLTLLAFMLLLNLCLGADKLIIFLVRDIVHLPPAQVGLVVTAGGAGGLLGAMLTGRLCRWLGPVRAISVSAGLSGIALIVISVASSAVVAATANALYTWAIIVASVTMRSLRQVLVPREMLGRVTASWRLGGQGVTLCGALLAGAMTAALGGDPRPVLAAAGCLTIGTVAAAWWTGLRNEELPAALTTGTGPPAGAAAQPAAR
jgi:predicted MFS family arabinose efflux permease